MEALTQVIYVKFAILHQNLGTSWKRYKIGCSYYASLIGYMNLT